MSLESILNDLEDFPLFGGILSSVLEPMADLVLSGEYREGEHLIEEGTRGNRLYVMVSGRAKVTSQLGEDSGGGKQTLELAELSRGETFGEMELIDTQIRSATVAALTPVKTVELTNMGFLEIFNRDPDVFRLMMMNLARDLSRRLRAADRRLATYLKTGKLPPGRGVES